MHVEPSPTPGTPVICETHEFGIQFEAQQVDAGLRVISQSVRPLHGHAVPQGVAGGAVRAAGRRCCCAAHAAPRKIIVKRSGLAAASEGPLCGVQWWPTRAACGAWPLTCCLGGGSSSASFQLATP